jgi:hypothetical protein
LNEDCTVEDSNPFRVVFSLKTPEVPIVLSVLDTTFVVSDGFSEDPAGR